MTIISLEGASAVGKTTTAKALCTEFDAYRVPEVNTLFDTSEEDATTWYFERQCDRWQLAVDRETDHELVILDGDVFQPIWYNWIAHHQTNTHATIDEFAPLDSICRFYREKLKEKSVGFPDRYFLLTATDETLRRRKRNDETRIRRNFEYHLQCITPQKMFFEKLHKLSPEIVRFLDAQCLSTNRSKIAAQLPREDCVDRYSIERLNALAEWVSETVPSLSYERIVEGISNTDASGQRHVGE
ncbi:ATP-binding protein [Halocatena marina]|uniref:ATP-binding protein n=1 Tax=Halocatena marina TaxID=2934937 RepID=UPI00200E2EFC|nr:ATP-binding protein [Halocatena marina]